MNTPELSLLPTDVEDDLRTTIRDLLDARCQPAAVIATYDGDRTVVEPLWRSFAVEMGLAGLLIPEELGGAGASAIEVAAVLEELGRACAPVPFLTSSVVATSALLGCAENEAAREALRAIASGERTAALVVPFSIGPDDVLPTTNTVRSVAGAIEADLLLVPTHTADGLALRLVDRSEATVEPVISLDMTRQVADVTIPSTVGTLISVDAEQTLRNALLVGAGLMASEQVGVARWCVEETVSYLKLRRQFDRVVGGFQALKHRLADLHAEVESASATARYAAAAIAAGQDVPIATHVAASYCADIAVHAAEEAVQLHGGIGMTWEHPTHLYLKRAKSDQIALGTAGAHRAALAPLIDLQRF